MLRFRVGETVGLDSFVKVGKATADNLVAAITANGRDLAELAPILDFGCGCGRTLMWLTERFPNVRFAGTDIDREAIAWCRANYPDVEFHVNGPEPPLDFPDGALGLVYAVSVFTHLSEEAQFRWLAELRRVLRPGGLLLATVHGEDAARILRPRDAATLRERGFVFCVSGKLQGILPEWYQTSFHTHAYVRRTWSRHLKVLDISAGAMGEQDLVIAEA
jgi:SAM-dependent methyltransferase